MSQSTSDVCYEDVRLPGSLPRFLRECSPVALMRQIDRDIPVGTRGVVLRVVDANTFIVAFCWSTPPHNGDDEVIAEVSGEDIEALLTDATGRAHAAWWLAKADDARWSKAAIHGVWNLTTLKQDPAYLTTYGAHNAWINVPSLADLDPNDPRLLPDGSRWVDAEALRRVCRHVAGVTP